MYINIHKWIPSEPLTLVRTENEVHIQSLTAHIFCGNCVKICKSVPYMFSVEFSLISRNSRTQKNVNPLKQNMYPINEICTPLCVLFSWFHQLMCFTRFMLTTNEWLDIGLLHKLHILITDFKMWFNGITTYPHSTNWKEKRRDLILFFILDNNPKIEIRKEYYVTINSRC